MPVIHTHVSVSTTPEQREALKAAYGKAITAVPGSAWEKLTESIMAALNSTLGIPEDRTYIRYTATTDWGWNGSNF